MRVALRERVPLVLQSVHTEDDPLQFDRDLVACSGSLNQNQMGAHCSADSCSLIFFLSRAVSLVASIPPVHFDVPCAVVVAGVVAVAFVLVAVADAVADAGVVAMVVVVAVDASAVVVAVVSVGNVVVAAAVAAALEPFDAPYSYNNLQSSSALHECSDTIGWSTL